MWYILVLHIVWRCWIDQKTIRDSKSFLFFLMFRNVLAWFVCFFSAFQCAFFIWASQFFFNSDVIETKTRLIFHCSTIHLSSCERHISEFLRFHETFDSAWQVWLPDFRFRRNLASNFGKHLEFWWPAFDHRRLSACFQRGHAKLSCIQIPLEICIAWRE